MPRPRVIDREHLLNVAEQILAKSGTIGLSFGSLATESGLSKASVQSVFGNREALIELMLDRWIEHEKVRFNDTAGPNPDRRAKVLAHVQTTAMESEASLKRIGSLLAAMVGSPQQLERVVDWYSSRIGYLHTETLEDRQLRIAFLATEGAFFLRFLIGFHVPDKAWEQIFEDLKNMICSTTSDKQLLG